LAVNFEHLEFRRLPIPLYETLDAPISGDLNLSGMTLPLQLSGNIAVEDAKSITNFDIRTKIMQTIAARGIAKARAPVDPALNLDIQVTSADSVYMKNRNMALSLGADLQVTGSGASPTVMLTLSIPRG